MMIRRQLGMAFCVAIALWLAACSSTTTWTPLDLSTVPNSPEATAPLATGAQAPLGVLHTADGKAYDLARAVEQHPAVLIFYRGGWCPYCTRHLVALRDTEEELRILGFRVYAISPDRPEKMRESMEQNTLTYTLLSDSTMELSHAFGLAFKLDEETLQRYSGFGINLEDASGQTHHLLPIPAVYIVDTDGKIQFRYTNPDYTVRLEPNEILDAAYKVRMIDR